MLADRGEDEVEELVAAQLVERRRDDPQALEQLRLVQVQHAREELALREVSGGAEEDDRGGWHGSSVAQIGRQREVWCR
ncbi:hypothetical protein GCM10009868_35330 [Terrabacter aerolatus]